MGLHDIDKGGGRRLSPTPNGNDAQLQRMAHNTVSTTYRQEGATTARIAFKNSVILYYDDQDRIIRVDGFVPELSQYPVTIIAKYGSDVYADILGLDPPTV